MKKNFCIVRDNTVISHEFEFDISVHGRDKTRQCTSADFESTDENVILIPDVFDDKVTDDSIPEQYKDIYNNNNACFIFIEGTEVDISFRYALIKPNCPASVAVLRLMFECPLYTRDQLYNMNDSINCSFRVGNFLIFYICRPLIHAHDHDANSLFGNYFLMSGMSGYDKTINFLVSDQKTVNLSQAIRVPLNMLPSVMNLPLEGR